jgi:Copper type II ascorbate-dependent monooxygenase, C-terminal domain
MKKRVGWTVGGLLATASFACGSERAQPTAEATAMEPTFWQDVAPILERKCTGCHQADGIAPFALDNFDDAEQRATLIADVTEARIMPPYLMEVGGACGSFDESQALTEAEIATIGAWARGPRRAGASAVITPHVPPSLPDGLDLFTPSFTPQIEGGVLAAFDEYRCFELDPELVEAAFVTGFEVSPGNTAIVHHAVLMLVDPAAPSYIDGLSNALAIERLRARDPNPGREGWSCFGEAGDGVMVEGSPGVWAPGVGAYEFPEGAGVRLLPGRKVVVQLHFNLARPEVRGQTDQTRVRLRLAPEVERLATFFLYDAFLATAFDAMPDTLEPGNPEARYSWTERLGNLGIPPGVPVDVVSVMPHMHERGRKYTFEVGRDGRFECQGHIPRWDFNWQRIYSYSPALTLDAESQLRVGCEYDTSADTAPVLPGWGTRNEMCEVTLGLVFPPGVQL